MSETRCEVLVFGPLRDLIGGNHITISLPINATANDVLAAVESTHPGFAAYRGRVAIACNERIVPLDARVRSTDVLALIPPVSGG